MDLLILCQVSFYHFLRIHQLSSESLVRQSPSIEVFDYLTESTKVTILIVAFVITERLLVQVSGKVIGFNEGVRTLQRSFQEAPEVLHPIRMHMALDVSDSVVNDLVNELLI
jgi:hypothetical protein